MSFKEIEIKRSYDSSSDDLIEDFYIPILKEAVSYKRVAGFFSSTILNGAMKGFYEIAKKRGKVELIISPKLSSEDVSFLSKNNRDLENELGSILLKEIEFSKSEFENDCKKLLGYMLYNDLLEIKIAILKKDSGEIPDFNQTPEIGMFHQKFGILEDQNQNEISFSGSINESISGWANNIEEFKVFKSWEESEYDYFKLDLNRFDMYWNNKMSNVEVINLPIAVKNKILESREEIDSLENLSLARFCRKKEKVKKDISLFSYQKEALDKFMASNNKMILEMATGTGKTRTAIACINELLKAETRMLIVISTPQSLLSLQWKDEIKKLEIKVDLEIIVSAINSSWRNKLQTACFQLNNRVVDSIIVYTTHMSSSKSDFINIIKTLQQDIKVFFIGDEVHGLGAKQMRIALDERYDYRLGLSATPNRWFDEDGTDLLIDYFGNTSFEFTLKNALTEINPITKKTFLTPYYYYPVAVELNDIELDEYIKLTKQLLKISGADEDKKESFIKGILNKRSDILKNASKKIDALEKILKNLEKIEDTIIFTSPNSFEKIENLLNKKEILYNIITQKQGAKPEKKYGDLSERSYIIKHFSERNYKVLLAMKCLDEGIDIPSARIGILYSNTTNPREYIQRIGRVIRRAPEKTEAYIFDFIIVPNLNNSLELKEHEKKIFEKEFKRAEYIAENAINQIDAITQLITINGGME